MGFSSALGLHGQGRGSPWAECLGEGKHIPKAQGYLLPDLDAITPFSCTLVVLRGAMNLHSPGKTPWALVLVSIPRSLASPEGN